MNEAECRAKVDALLRQMQWRLPGADSPTVRMEQRTGSGRPDYTLNDSRGFPLAVIEVKNSNIEPLHGKEQARAYAEELSARFVILTNGNLHYLWDLHDGNPSLITEMLTQESLERRRGLHIQPSKFSAENIGTDYIERTQGTNTPKERLRSLRCYQLRAVQAVQNAAADGKKRFLLAMATGTGKTLVAAALIKLFLRSGNAQRVLFLVDRLELEDQAHKNFVDYLGNDYQSVIYKTNRDDWNRAEIIVSTVQSLAFNDRWRRFSPLDFDLLIVDEAHRAIGGQNSRAVFEYFIAYKLGLTATPRDFMRGIDAEDLTKNNPQALEARQLRDTYFTFGCGENAPTFFYELMEGVREEFLIKPYIIDARTEITTQLLSDKGVTFTIRDDDDEEHESAFHRKDYERRLFSEATNRAMCRTFMENARRDPISKEIGKSIAYCISQDHAAKITHILNKLANEMFPGKYQSDFAIQVTSRIADAQQFARTFANNNLHGHTRFLEDYASSKTRVCVTVGMMTTGYDCSDILNLCFMRPMFSPSEFIQMKGRGTRRHTFQYRDGAGRKHCEEKEMFKLFDFFAVCEYFENEHIYDEQLQLPSVSEAEAGGDRDDRAPLEQSSGSMIYKGQDALSTFREIQVRDGGLRPDRELYARFGERVRNDAEVSTAVAREQWDTAVRLFRDKHENKPDDYVTLESIATAENLNRRLDTKEVLLHIFGHIDRFKDRDELLMDEAQQFVAIENLDAGEAHRAFPVFMAYIDNERIRRIIDSGHTADLSADPTLPAQAWWRLQEKTRQAIRSYARDYARLERFERAA